MMVPSYTNSLAALNSHQVYVQSDSDTRDLPEAVTRQSMSWIGQGHDEAQLSQGISRLGKGAPLQWVDGMEQWVSDCS